MIETGNYSLKISGEYLTNLSRKLLAEGSLKSALKILDEGFDEISLEEALMICNGTARIIDFPDGTMTIEGESEEAENELYVIQLGKIKLLDRLD